jgi:hypothetical protein
MQKLVDYFRRRGTARLVGEALPENHALLELARGFDFHTAFDSEQRTVELTLTL